MTSTPTRWSRAARAAIVTALLAVSALALGACGGSSSSAARRARGSAGSSAGVSAADKVAAQWAQRPTRIPVTQPIGKPIPSGKRIDFINCGVTSCTILYKNLVDAAKSVGWTVRQINTAGTPESVQAAWKQAVNDRPDAVIASGFPRAVFAQQLKQLQALKIPVLESSTDDVEGNGIDLILNGPKDLRPSGQILASWIAKDSGGKANTLYVDLPSFGILKPVRQFFQQYYAQWCKGCKSQTVDIPVTAIGKDVPDRVVSYLRAHPGHQLRRLLAGRAERRRAGGAAPGRARQQGQDDRDRRRRRELPVHRVRPVAGGDGLQQRRDSPGSGSTRSRGRSPGSRSTSTARRSCRSC